MPTKTNLRNVSQSVQDRQDFSGSNLHGHLGVISLDPGRLPARFHQALNDATKADDFYVVLSYATPIAWFANGQWFVPSVKYSVSTSRQLSSLRIPNPTYL